MNLEASSAGMKTGATGVPNPGLVVLKWACSLGLAVCGLAVVGLTINIAVALFTPPFGLAGVRDRIGQATADLGTNDTVLGIEASALVPFVAIAVYIAAIAGFWFFDRAGSWARDRLVNSDIPEEEP